MSSFDLSLPQRSYAPEPMAAVELLLCAQGLATLQPSGTLHHGLHVIIPHQEMHEQPRESNMSSARSSRPCVLCRGTDHYSFEIAADQPLQLASASALHAEHGAAPHTSPSHTTDSKTPGRPDGKEAGQLQETTPAKHDHSTTALQLGTVASRVQDLCSPAHVPVSTASPAADSTTTPPVAPQQQLPLLQQMAAEAGFVLMPGSQPPLRQSPHHSHTPWQSSQPATANTPHSQQVPPQQAVYGSPSPQQLAQAHTAVLASTAHWRTSPGYQPMPHHYHPQQQSRLPAWAQQALQQPEAVNNSPGYGTASFDGHLPDQDPGSHPISSHPMHSQDTVWQLQAQQQQQQLQTAVHTDSAWGLQGSQQQLGAVAAQVMHLMPGQSAGMHHHDYVTHQGAASAMQQRLSQAPGWQHEAGKAGSCQVYICTHNQLALLRIAKCNHCI